MTALRPITATLAREARRAQADSAENERRERAERYAFARTALLLLIAEHEADGRPDRARVARRALARLTLRRLGIEHRPGGGWRNA